MKKLAIIMLCVFFSGCMLGCNAATSETLTCAPDIDEQNTAISAHSVSEPQAVILNSLSEGNDNYSISSAYYNTIEETKYYKITTYGFFYYYYIFDNNGDVVMSDGPLSRKPSISIDNYLVKFILQTGTGIGTQWGFYYHIKMDVFSRIFYCIHDQFHERVVFVNMNKVIVRDIFDKTKFYMELDTFAEPFSEMVEPITSVRFVNSGKCVEVRYLTGSNYQEVVEVFDLY